MNATEVRTSPIDRFEVYAKYEGVNWMDVASGSNNLIEVSEYQYGIRL